jgi:EpsI family protein
MNSASRSSWFRFSIAVLILAATFGLLRAREREEVLSRRDNLAAFPMSLGDWVGSDLAMSPGVLETLGPGEFLFRDYVNVKQRRLANLFIAFFPSQRQGDTIHSPKNCLPGSGWIPVQASREWITLQDGRRIEVNRYLVEKGTERAVVLYWYQSHGRVTPSEYKAKYPLVADSISMNRSDGAMIRITTFPANGESIPDADGRAVQFAQLAAPFLDSYIPR